MMLGPNHALNPNQDALIDKILAERAALNADLAPRPSKDGDEK